MKYHCSHPDHVGDRLIDRYDAIEERLDWRSKKDDSRYRTIHVRYVCSGCADADIAKAEGHPVAYQEALLP